MFSVVLFQHGQLPSVVFGDHSHLGDQNPFHTISVASNAVHLSYLPSLVQPKFSGLTANMLAWQLPKPHLTTVQEPWAEERVSIVRQLSQWAHTLSWGMNAAAATDSQSTANSVTLAQVTFSDWGMFVAADCDHYIVTWCPLCGFSRKKTKFSL